MQRDDPFLQSREWQVLRMRALERDGAKCSCCGRRAGREAGVEIVINVDHVKPRLRYPELALTLDNLQVLCNLCNRGKGNTFETDWRQESGIQELTPEQVERARSRKPRVD